MSTKERLHQLIDEMEDDQAAGLLLDLEEPAPPLTDEDRRSIARAFADSEAGRTRPHSAVMRKYGLAD